MTNDLGNLVHPIFRRALALRARLEHGENVIFEVEQALLKGLLLTDFEARRWPEFGGEAWQTGTSSPFLGVRYPLACWLDELFSQTCWADLWRERTLEEALYGTKEGARKFWEQARQAEARANPDGLETFFLCVMLGFRGDRRNSPEPLRQWVAAAQARLTSAQNLQWRGPGDLEPAVNVERLRARERWHHLVLAAGLALLAMIPAATFYVVRQLAQ
jgi:type VI secretion system protein ImpK